MAVRRVAGAAALALFVAGTVVVPAHHLATHGTRPVAPADIDLEELIDPSTGRVDLDQLARALGLGTPEHDEGHPHRHGPGPEGEHGDGSLEHLTYALASAPPPPQTPACRDFARWEKAPPRYVSQVPRLVFLEAQRAQAPPA